MKIFKENRTFCYTMNVPIEKRDAEQRLEEIKILDRLIMDALNKKVVPSIQDVVEYVKVRRDELQRMV